MLYSRKKPNKLLGKKKKKNFLTNNLCMPCGYFKTVNYYAKVKYQWVTLCSETQQNPFTTF